MRGPSLAPHLTMAGIETSDLHFPVGQDKIACCQPNCPQSFEANRVLYCGHLCKPIAIEWIHRRYGPS